MYELISRSSFEKKLIEKIRNDRKILSCYLMLGYPDLDSSIELITEISKYADIIELGIPFSDPIADGPTIQKCSTVAMNNGTVLDDVWAVVRHIKSSSQCAVVLMTYGNILIQNSSFENNASSSDLDSLIIPDMPLEHFPESYHNIGGTFILSPNSPDGRIEPNVNQSNGFVYVVAQLGITGTGFRGDERNLQLVQKIRAIDPEKPILFGFGIKSMSDVKQVMEYGADGVIIGSEILKKVETEGISASIGFVKAIRSGLDNL